MRTALAALGWPASLTGAGTPASHRHSPTCRFQVMTGRGLCAGVALRLHKVCGETAAGRRMRRADVKTRRERTRDGVNPGCAGRVTDGFGWGSVPVVIPGVVTVAGNAPGARQARGGLELRRGIQASCSTGPGKSSFHSNCELELGIPLQTLQGQIDLI